MTPWRRLRGLDFGEDSVGAVAALADGGEERTQAAVVLEAAVPSKLGTLWGRRRILLLLISRDLKVKYAGSPLGYLWSVLEPLMLAGIYWFIFTQLIQRRLGESPYVIFLLCGVLPWQFFAGSLRASMKALSKDAKLVRSTNLPREIWILRTVGSKMAEFLFSLPVILFFALLTGAHLTWYVVFFPLALFIQVVLLVGCGLLLAPLSVLYSDVGRVLPIILRLMFYFSPILYGVHDIRQRFPPTAVHIFAFNPLAGILDLYRTAFFNDEWAGWSAVAVSVVWAVGAMVLGAYVFPRLEGTVLKEI
jgi:ABC-2 type transport system permease protein